jgi:hypothetical protein
MDDSTTPIRALQEGKVTIFGDVGWIGTWELLIGDWRLAIGDLREARALQSAIGNRKLAQSGVCPN